MFRLPPPEASIITAELTVVKMALRIVCPRLGSQNQEIGCLYGLFKQCDFVTDCTPKK